MKAKLMGVLNVTPDSFSDGGQFQTVEDAVSRGLKMVEEGVDILDVGGESTRPGSSAVSLQQELDRVTPVIKALKLRSSIQISIDTMKPDVAAAAIEAGATLINDVAGFRNEKMVETAVQYDVDICCVHMLGIPKSMQNQPEYKEGVIEHLLRWMEERVEYLTKAGVKDQRIILDPGIGFGKTVAHNLEILHNLNKLKSIGFPLLVGASRKSFITKILGKPPLELGAATIAAHTAALLGGADYIRAHDVAEHRDVLDIVSCLQSQ
ncbi:MAG: dihydropteroate synthase [Chlamydiota bacterium]